MYCSYVKNSVYKKNILYRALSSFVSESKKAHKGKPVTIPNKKPF